MTSITELREAAEALLKDRVLDPFGVASLLYLLIRYLEEQERADT